MKPVFALVTCAVLSACSSPASQTSVPTKLDTETLSLSCAELSLRDTRIKTRIRELEDQERQRARRNAVTDTLLNVGVGAVIGVGAQGGVSGLRTASATVQGIETVRTAERASGTFQNVSDVLALARRSSELQRAMIEKGCSRRS